MYKVEFNKSELEDGNIAKQSRCVLAVSMSVEAYEQPKLSCILKLIDKNFSECIIVIGDTLYRHNYLFFPQYNYAQYERHCLDVGYRWLERNMPSIIKELTIPFKIMRWNAFISNKNFAKYLSEIEYKYYNDATYKQVFTDVASEFLGRQGRLEIIKNDLRYFEQCIKYLQEECAAICTWPELGCEYEIYFNTRNAAVSLVYKDLIRPQYPKLLQPLSLRFFKKKENPSDVQTIADTYTLRQMIETLPGHIYWQNKEGAYLGCNMQQARYYGFTSISDVINKTDYDFLDKVVADQVRKNDLKIMKRKSHVIVEETNNQDCFLSSKSAIVDSDGNSIGIIGCSINITKQKMLALKLKNQTEMLNEVIRTKDRFLNNLSHEIRTPVHVIASVVDELLAQYYHMNDDEKIEFMQLLRTTTQRLSKLVKNILLLAKAKRGKLLTYVEKVELVSVIQDVIKELLVISNVKITFNTKDPIYLDCSKYQMEQVIRNLIENAIRYGQNKSVSVSLYCDKAGIKIEVIDQGVGVPETEKLKIFEVFEEGERTRSISGGTGLGLAICKDIVEAHHGKIWVESQEGKGAKFIVMLPFNKRK